jgi:hypothetical protein
MRKAGADKPDPVEAILLSTSTGIDHDDHGFMEDVLFFNTGDVPF